jgi:Zn-dependent protease with chaperone function
MMIDALYFDGRTAFAHPVRLSVENGALTMHGESETRTIPVDSLALGEPFATATCVVALPGGGQLEVRHQRADLLALLGYRPNGIERMQARWPGALAGLLVLLVAFFLGYNYGIPAAAERLADAIPPSVEISIGTAAEEAMMGELLKPSRLSDDRIAELQALFKRLQPDRPRLPLKLVVSDAPTVRANAFALPNGTIVLTDEMVRAVMGRENVWDADTQRMIAGVLAHEIAHVEGRHSARAMARSSLLLGATWALFGDFSAVAAGLPALVGEMRYSQEMEWEADEAAVKLLRARGYSAGDMADMFTMLTQYIGEQGLDAEDELPDWMRDTMSYLGSHPSMADRISALRDMQDEEGPEEPPAACGSEQTGSCDQK